jgi:hypothetical protein
MSRVYAHSGDTLYRLNPTTLSAMQIGAMTGIDGNLLDLAVDNTDRIVGTTRTQLYSINATTGAATLIRMLDATAQGFTSLSFIPDPAGTGPDLLISANEDGDVFQINESSGVATLVGNYGMHNGMQVKSSGDLFGVRGYGIYATVDVGTGTMDYLAKVDPANGWKATPLAQSADHDKIFGLGFWGGKIYGFVDNGFEAGTGTMLQLDSVTGAATVLSSGNERWFGAGVTTDAPIIQ